MLRTFDLANCFYFATVISTFDTAYLCFFVINLSAVALLYLIKVLIVLIPLVTAWHIHFIIKQIVQRQSITDRYLHK